MLVSTEKRAICAPETMTYPYVMRVRARVCAVVPSPAAHSFSAGRAEEDRLRDAGECQMSKHSDHARCPACARCPPPHAVTERVRETSARLDEPAGDRTRARLRRPPEQSPPAAKEEGSCRARTGVTRLHPRRPPPPPRGPSAPRHSRCRQIG